MKRTGFQNKPRKPLKRVELKRKTPLRASTSPLKRSRLRRVGKTPLAKAKAELWQLCRKIAYERDKVDGGDIYCYTCGCGPLVGSNKQLGHFIPKSVCSAPMKYDLGNLRYQCFRCNINLSGNWPAFEAHLMTEKGRDFPDKLKKRNQELSGGDYKLIWYEEQIINYKKLL